MTVGAHRPALRIACVAVTLIGASACSVTLSDDEGRDGRQRGVIFVDEENSADYAVDADGKRIVKSTGDRDSAAKGLVIRDIGGKSFVPLLKGREHRDAYAPVWMDKTHIAFLAPAATQGTNQRNALWVGSTDGTAIEVPDPVVGGEEWEAWTVSEIVGAKPGTIYFASKKLIGSGRELVSIAPDGSNREVLDDLGDDNPFRSDLTLNPDGKRALWTQEGDKSNFDNPSNVMVGDIDGSNAHVLGAGQQPAWSPDGDKVVFLAKSGKKEKDGLPLLGIYTVPADGSAKAKLQPGGYCCWSGRVTWLPDNRIILSDAAYVVGDGRLYAVKLQ